MNSNPKEKILIIGGAGRMGRLFSALFEKHHFAVTHLEKDEPLNKEVVGSFPFVLLATPMSVASTVAKEIAPLLAPDALFFDINSLKEEVCSVMANGSKGEVLGLHPMFGPTVHGINGQTIIVCSVRGGAKSERVISILKEEGSNLVESTPVAHDKMMARVQALTHFVKVALGEAWREGELPVKESLQFVSPIYLLELSIVGRIFAQAPELYAEIEMANPYAAAERHRFLSAANKLGQIVDGGDREAFVSLFKGVSKYMAEFSSDALTLSDGVVDYLTSSRKTGGSIKH